MERAPGFGWSMAVALALHVSAFAGLWLTRPPVSFASPIAGEEIPIDLTLDPGPPAPSPPLPPPREPSSQGAQREPRIAAVARAAAPGRPRRESLVTPPADDVAGAAVGDVAAPAPSPAGEGDVAAPPAPTGEIVASPAPTRDALPPPLLPRVIPAPKGVFDAPLEGPRAGVGISAGGQVMGLARSVADARAPRQGRGTIRVEVDANGRVVGVTSTSPSWEAYAGELRAKLAGKRLRVPPGSRGVLIRIAVSAEVTSAPAVLTGDAKSAPCRDSKQDMGRVESSLDPACIDYKALLPGRRRRVSVSLAGEQSL